MYRRILPAISLLAVLASPAVAQQQTNSSTVFDNWLMNCSTQTDKDNKTLKACEVRSTLIVQDQQTKQQGVAAVIAVGRAMTEKTMRAAVQLPIAAQLNKPVKLAGADDKALIDLQYAACQPQMCSAVADLTDAQVAALKKAGEKIFLVYTNQAGQEVKLDAATKGLSQALDTLAREK
ncbi:invasion associated locus B family protein [Microvirga sp. W0021]|uniref:Invasion associated locus B family protein n=1 Tax=Hohaiivirga grylli TaxID=3133970 RepID=A0ABV0BJJ0_9HYPH